MSILVIQLSPRPRLRPSASPTPAADGHRLTEEFVYALSPDGLQLAIAKQASLFEKFPCRDVFKAGQWQVEVFGPFPEVENEVAAAHIGFWDREVAPA